MIGTDLDLDLPSLSDTLATIVSKLVAALEAVEDSIADRATPAALDINTALNLSGNALTNTTAIQFASGNASAVAGSLFYFDGDFYAADAVGLIQLTDNGALNASGIGGIVGDYGGVNPARVSYDDASGEYRFTEDTGVYADLVADDLVLKGAAGEIRLGVDAALTSSSMILFKSLPSSGKSLLVYDAATSTLEDNAVTRATNMVLVTGLDASGTIEASVLQVDSDRVILVAPSAAQTSNAAHTLAAGSGAWSYGASTQGVYYPLTLTVGQTLKAAKVYCSRTGGGSMTLEVLKAGVSLGSQTNNTAGPLSFTLSVTGLAHTVVEDGSAYTLRITTDGTTAQTSGNAAVTVTGKV